MTGYDRTQNTAVKTFIDLTKWLLFDEWRRHARLGASFLVLFPVVLFGLTAAGSVYQSGEGYTQLLFFLVFAFGVQLGISVFIRRWTAPQSNASPSTLLLLAPKSLPVSPQLVAASFLVKQTVYYGFGVATPIALGLIIEAPQLFSAAVFSMFLTLVLGISIGIILGTALATRSRLAVSLSLIIGAIIIAAPFGIPSHLLTPYQAFIATTSLSAFVALATTTVAASLAILVFTPNARQRHRMVNSKFEWIQNELPFSISPITTRTLLLIHRGRGGFLKIVIGLAVFFGAIGLVLAQLRQQTPILHVGVLTGGLTTLGAFPIYYWIVQADEQTQYIPLPIGRGEVIQSLSRVYSVMVIPTAVFSYLFLAQVTPIPYRDFLLGGVVAVSISTYFGGVLFYTAGLSPSTLTLRPRHFSLITTAIIVPVGSVGLFAYTAPPLTTTTLGIAAGICGLFAIIGVWLIRQSATFKWRQS